MLSIRHVWPFAVAVLLAGLLWTEIYYDTGSRLAPDLFYALGDGFFLISPIWLIFSSIYYLRLNRFPGDTFWSISVIGTLPLLSLPILFFAKMGEVGFLIISIIFPVGLFIFYSLRLRNKPQRMWIDYVKWGIVTGVICVPLVLSVLQEYKIIETMYPFGMRDETFGFICHMLILALFALNIYHLHLRQRQKMILRQEAQIGEIGREEIS